MKYLILLDQDTSSEHAVLFTPMLSHKEVAAALDTMKVISAGLCSIAADTVKCYGRSETLGIDSHEDDNTIINTFFKEKEEKGKIFNEL